MNWDESRKLIETTNIRSVLANSQKLLEDDGYELEVEVDDIKEAIKEVFLEMKETGELTTWIQSIVQESMKDILKEEKEQKILEDLKDIKMIVRRLEYK